MTMTEKRRTFVRIIIKISDLPKKCPKIILDTKFDCRTVSGCNISNSYKNERQLFLKTIPYIKFTLRKLIIINLRN